MRKKVYVCVYVVFINYPYVRWKVQRGVLCHLLSEACFCAGRVFFRYFFVKGLRQPYGTFCVCP